MVTRIVVASAVLAAALLAAPGPGGRAAEGAAGVIVCDDLIALRRLMTRPDAAAHLPEHPGCRRVEAARIGVVARRAMVGGAPFECLALDGGACVWPQP